MPSIQPYLIGAVGGVKQKGDDVMAFKPYPVDDMELPRKVGIDVLPKHLPNWSQKDLTADCPCGNKATGRDVVLTKRGPTKICHQCWSCIRWGYSIPQWYREFVIKPKPDMTTRLGIYR